MIGSYSAGSPFRSLSTRVYPGMSSERKPIWPWIAALLIGLPVMYVASFGPACWLVAHEVLPTGAAHPYRSLVTRAALSYDFVSRTLRWYAELGARDTIIPELYASLVLFEENSTLRKCIEIAVAVTFAAFCIWLALRFVNRRERWVLIVLITAILFGATWAAVFKVTWAEEDTALNLSRPDEPFGWLWLEPASAIISLSG